MCIYIYAYMCVYACPTLWHCWHVQVQVDMDQSTVQGSELASGTARSAPAQSLAGLQCRMFRV